MTLQVGIGPGGSALVQLAQGFAQFVAQPAVRAKYAAERIAVPVVAEQVSWKERESQLNTSPTGGNRVVFMPGWGLTTRNHGGVADPANPTASPRSLATWRRKFTVSLWAYDPSSPQDQNAQLTAIETMHETLRQGLRAVLTGFERYDGSEIYQDVHSENLPYGTEYLVPCAFDLRVYDLPNDVTVNVTGLVDKNPAT